MCTCGVVMQRHPHRSIFNIPQAQGEYEEGAPEWCEDQEVSYETRTKVHF